VTIVTTISNNKKNKKKKKKNVTATELLSLCDAAKTLIGGITSHLETYLRVVREFSGDSQCSLCKIGYEFGRVFLFRLKS